MSASFSGRLVLGNLRPLTMIGSAGAAAALSAMLLLASARPAAAVDIIPIADAGDDLNAFLLVGEIREGDDAKLLNHLASLAKKRFTTAYLVSGGGDLVTGMELGRIFRQRKIRTVVQPVTINVDGMAKPLPGICASACALAFLGGTDPITNQPWRTKAGTAKLGFHSFRSTYADKVYTPQDMSDAVENAQRTAFSVIEYMQDIDLSLRFVPVMFKAEAKDMNWVSNLDATDKLGIHVINEALPREKGFIPSNRIAPAGGQNIAQHCPVEPPQ